MYTELNNIICFLDLNMPIDQDFSSNRQVIRKYLHHDEEHYHFVWGAGKIGAAENEEIKAAILREVRNWLHYECMVI